MPTDNTGSLKKDMNVSESGLERTKERRLESQPHTPTIPMFIEMDMERNKKQRDGQLPGEGEVGEEHSKG